MMSQKVQSIPSFNFKSLSGISSKVLLSTAAISSFVVAQMVSVSQALAQAPVEAPVLAPGAGPAPVGGAMPQWLNFALMGGMIFFLYLFIIRPQAKRQKEHKTFIDALKTGQEVITSSGLIGRITSISENIVTVDLGSGSVRVLKSAISGELNKSGAGGTPATTTAG